MFHWAFVSNSTVAPLVPRLKKELSARKLECKFHITEHGNLAAQVFQANSDLYRFKPDLTVIYLDLAQIRSGLEHSLALEKPEVRESVVAETVAHVAEVIKAIRTRNQGTILVNTFTVLPRTALGIGMDPVYRRAIRQINQRIYETASDLPQCHVYDLESLWAEAGFQAYDRRFEFMAQFPFGPTMQQLLVTEWMRYFRALQGLSRKCVVLDLDNTLWGGILGEDGADGIRIGDTPAGRPYLRFQQALKALSKRGVLLAINSKNNLTDVLPILRDHPEMVLRESDFAAMQVNWDDKATNLSRLSKDLNIGLGHMVFLDDSASERGWVRERLPEVLVPEMPREASGYLDVLNHCELDTLTVTAEDLKRAKMYWEEKQRRELQAEAPSFEQFLEKLNLSVKVELLRPELLDRATQLCQRTNQFNLTTRRHSADHLKRVAESPNSAVLLMNAADRFGDYGWSGLAIVEAREQTLFVESFLMSCRVMGKNAEFAFLSGVLQWAKQKQCLQIRGQFIPTAKNAPCKDFLARCGFQANGSNGEQWFGAEIANLPLPRVDYIDLAVDLVTKS
ncbi:MAG TPA: HAD-IIIC family phosphatase [Verrucomicrobiae bacterium]|nr:HAD-IIIC family phosphatase [Verrucomicrobiae bacterium]